MKAAVVVEDRKMIVTDVPKPEPGLGEVRIKVDLAGICGSDHSLFYGKCKVPFPVIGGHEAVGRIEKIGKGVTGFETGQRITIHPNFSCGECPICLGGHPNICPKKIRLGIDANGVFAEYVVVPAKQLFLIPDGMDDALAVFTEPLSVAVHAMNITAPAKGDRVLVFGAGVVGLLTLQMALYYGAKVTACDLEEKRIALARKLGSENTIGPESSLASFYNSFDLIYETSGAPVALAEAVRLAAPGGKIVVLGLPGKEHALSTELIVRKELQILGSMIYTDEFQTSINLLQSGKINTGLLTTARVGLDDLDNALTNFRSPDRVKTLVTI
jgi:2-desacetyl-2-hydroxyethyl bacteriochlorophyllide A dehydrogenase